MNDMSEITKSDIEAVQMFFRGIEIAARKAHSYLVAFSSADAISIGIAVQALNNLYPGHHIDVHWDGSLYWVGVIGIELSADDYLLEPGLANFLQSFSRESAAEESGSKSRLATVEVQNNEPAGTRTQNQRIKS